MVGFSGILFAWMVVATLQTQQKSCPVFFMPDLCFDVYQIGGFTVSLGPLVQLLVLQVILPRASFVGHLAGIVVGFLFHWKMQPPLEWSQPCLLFPLVWFIGKWACLKYFEPIHTDTSSSNSGGRMLGTGQAGTGAVVPWRTNAIQASHTSHEEDRSAALWSLNALRFAVTVHTVVLLGAAFWKNPINSIIISEVILAAFLTFIARASRSTTAATELLGQKFTIGMLGKAFVVTVLVQCITDSMTLAGWTVAGCSAFGGWTILSLWMIRLFLLIVSLCIVCQLLNLTGELPQQGPNSTWSHVLGWWVVKPCSMAGKWLAENLGNRYAGRRINSDDDSQIHTRENTSNNQVLRGRVVSEVV
jgi:Rhomboid family